MAEEKARNNFAKNPKEQELVITRIFDAPREQVWKAWTDPERVKRWWGPKGYTAPFARIDLRVGGTYLYCMRSPEGRDFWSTGVYREIVEPERIVATDSFSDTEGNVVPASHYGMSGDWPSELLVTVTFVEEDGRTELTLRHAGIPPGEMRDLTRAGWNESLDKLAESLEKEPVEITKTSLVAEPGRQEIVITRVFDAPRELVFKAFTDPELYPQWLGPRRLTMTLETFEPRSGGSWRYIQKDANGNEFAFHGVNHEVASPQRIISTFEFEGLPEKGHVVLETARFEELPGNRTKLTSQSVFQSVADRDGMLQSGMEEGVNESYDRLDELLEKMQK